MRTLLALALALVLLAPLLPAARAELPGLGGITVLTTVGPGHLRVRLPSDATDHRVHFDPPDVDAAFWMSAQGAFSNMVVRTGGQQMPRPDLEYPPGANGLLARDYNVYVFAPPGVALTVHLELAGVPGSANLAMEPWSGGLVPTHALPLPSTVVVPADVAQAEVDLESPARSAMFFVNAGTHGSAVQATVLWNKAKPPVGQPVCGRLTLANLFIPPGFEAYHYAWMSFYHAADGTFELEQDWLNPGPSLVLGRQFAIVAFPFHPTDARYGTPTDEVTLEGATLPAPRISGIGPVTAHCTPLPLP